MPKLAEKIFFSCLSSICPPGQGWRLRISKLLSFDKFQECHAILSNIVYLSYLCWDYKDFEKILPKIDVTKVGFPTNISSGIVLAHDKIKLYLVYPIPFLIDICDLTIIDSTATFF